MKLTKHEQAIIDFLEKSSSNWNNFESDSVTLRTIASLQDKRLIEVNGFGQMRLTAQKDKMNFTEWQSACKRGTFSGSYESWIENLLIENLFLVKK